MTIMPISRLLNVAPHEWPRLSIAWGARFLLRTGFIMAWTILVAIFVSRRGIEHLPYFFIAYGIFTILGAVAFMGFIRRIRRDILIMGATLAGSATLSIATMFLYRSEQLFLTIAVIALGALLAQVSIILSLFTEELFTPLESHRVFPVIESAESIGGIIAGLLLAQSSAFVSPFKLLHIVVLILFCIVPLTLLYLRHIRKTPALFFQKKDRKDPLTRVQEGWNSIKKIPFLQGLAVVVLLQWFFVSILDFQYTKAIEETVTAAEAAAQLGPAVTAMDHSAQLTQTLGQFHMVLFGGALIMQLLFASKILRSLGTIPAMILHPLVALVSILGVTLRFGLPTAVIAKTTTEMTGIIYKNAYESSYYALPHDLRGTIKEMLEGMVKPFGGILAMTGIALFGNLIATDRHITIINLSMLGVLAIMIWVLYRLRDRFTHLSTQHLRHSGLENTKLQAIEILGQNGHTEQGSIRLVHLLRNSEEPEEIKIKVLDMLGKLQETKTIPDIIQALHTESADQTLAALHALAAFDDLGKHFFEHTFSRHRIITELERLLECTNDPQITSAVMRVFAKLRVDHVAALLVRRLQGASSPELKADVIRVMGLFHDPAIATYLLPFLRAQHPRVAAETLIALWQFPSYRSHIMHEIENLLDRAEPAWVTAGIYVLGEIKAVWEHGRLWSYFTGTEPTQKYAAALALAKLEDRHVVPYLAEHIRTAYASYPKAKRTLLAELPEKIQRAIEQEIHETVSHNIHLLIGPYTRHGVAGQLPQKILGQISALYQFLGEYGEAHALEAAKETA